MRHRLPILVAMVLISVLTIGVMSSEAVGSNQSASDHGKLIGEARTSSAGSPVAQIGSVAVTDADFDEQKQIVASNLSYMQTQIAAGSPNSVFLQKFVNLIQAHDAASVALAALIGNRSVYLFAVQRGYEPSASAIKAKVEQDRALVHTQGTPPEMQAYIDVVGESYYWSTLYLQIAERDLATQALYASVIKNIPNAADAAAAWLHVEQRAVAATPVTVTDPAAIAPATRASAMNYLTAYWALSAAE